MIPLYLMKSSEVRKAGDQSNYQKCLVRQVISTENNIVLREPFNFESKICKHRKEFKNL